MRTPNQAGPHYAQARQGGADAVAKEFFPEGNKRVLAVVNIGKPGPDAWKGRLPRLDYEEVVAEV
jgi:3-hydroxypropanoate dehydrogenase